MERVDRAINNNKVTRDIMELNLIETKDWEVYGVSKKNEDQSYSNINRSQTHSSNNQKANNNHNTSSSKTPTWQQPVIEKTPEQMLQSKRID